MKKRDSTMGPGDRILIHLKQHGGLRHDQLLGNVPYYLASAILEQHSFDTIECLVAFCEDPDNMRPWLPSEADRIVFSDELVQRLHEMRPDAPAGSQTSVDADSHASTASCKA